MESYEILVTILLTGFILLLFTGFPIAWILGGIALIFSSLSIFLGDNFGVDTYLLDNWKDYALIIDRIWSQVQNWVLVALPMFVFMGLMLDRSGVAETMMSNFVKLFGRLRGGLALTVVFIGVVPAAGLIIAVLGTIFFGIATPTEASGVGAFGATLLALVNRRLDLATMRQVCIETMQTTSFIFAIFIGATAFSLVMRSLGGDEFIGTLLRGLPFGPTGIVIFILFVGFVAGFFLDWLEITLIMLPLVAPVVKDLGFDLVWFVVLFAVCLQTSFLTPPVGFSLFYLKGVCPPQITTMHIYRGIIPFVLLQMAAVAAVFIWPDLVLWLPAKVYAP
ncbi:MAG: TRAP transporter large permease subunit [Alphaproteobacteria bacterium]|nr:TRAP transporter large permease subunit [Alphaproteobacteria bacterium]